MNARNIMSFAATLVFAVAIGLAVPPAGDPLKVTVLYDNTSTGQDFKADWGFAALVEGAEKPILFDTGAKSDILAQNIKAAKVDLSKTGALVISHAHMDHVGGLTEVLAKLQGTSAYVPASSPSALLEVMWQGNVLLVAPKGPREVCKNVWLTGEMGEEIKEQALVFATPKGLIVLTGCSHPGIVRVLERAVEVGNQKIYAVMGGFHLLEHNDAAIAEIVARFRELGVQKVGATHCTGDKAIAAFRKAYGTNFIEMGAGRVVPLD
jgi:7,8-dihydropterin-6-yl-methyl-4-(beta-D-ribofuranosyl)aminobenzene 5'-phosphate synthase